jgi:hypothetical protein
MSQDSEIRQDAQTVEKEIASGDIDRAHDALQQAAYGHQSKGDLESFLGALQYANTNDRTHDKCNFSFNRDDGLYHLNSPDNVPNAFSKNFVVMTHGESLWGIAEKTLPTYGGANWDPHPLVEDLKTQNNIQDPRDIPAGKLIRMPNHLPYPPFQH